MLGSVAATVEDDASAAVVAEGALPVAGVPSSGTSSGSASAREGEIGEVGSMIARIVDTGTGVGRAERPTYDGAMLLAAVCQSLGGGESEDFSGSVEHPQNVARTVAHVTAGVKPTQVLDITRYATLRLSCIFL
jgi:hypothetical protein